MDSENQYNPDGIVLWMDDNRRIRPGFDVWAQNGEEALVHIRSGRVRAMSFDSDMGPGLEGVDVSKEIQGLAMWGKILPIRCCIHTANSDARKAIALNLTRAYQFWHVTWDIEHDYDWTA